MLLAWLHILKQVYCDLVNNLKCGSSSFQMILQ